MNAEVCVPVAQVEYAGSSILWMVYMTQCNTLTVLVVILRAPNSLVHIPSNARLDMPFHRARLCTRRVDLDPRPFVHVGSRFMPGVNAEYGV